MAISTTTVAAVSVPTSAAPQGVAPQLVLQPGTVVTADVLKVLDANLVRIAINNLTIDVQTEVQLQLGAVLNLAVSQTADGGIRLAIVPNGAAAAAAASGTAGAGSAAPATAPGVSAATDTSAIATPLSVAEAAAPVLTPAQAEAVSVAEQAAAARQSGLSPLFADTAAALDTLPAALQPAAAQLLATRTDLTTALDATDLQTAFQNSGLFLEASLAAGSPLPGQAGGPIDLKAALLVFRDTVSGYLNETAAPETGLTVAAAPTAAQVADATAQPKSALTPTPYHNTGNANGAGGLRENPEITGELVIPGHDAAVPAGAGSAAARAAAATTALNLLQDFGAALPSGLADAVRKLATAAHAAADLADSGIAAGHAPPPPFRGAAPSPQPVAQASIGADTAPRDAVRRLLDDADGAIARQTLLQIASLPDRGDASGSPVDRSMPRWNFEIPFATPQGTAVAQFEISRDGGGHAVETAGKVWRARFTLNLEPAGPVHALVALNGGTTSVRMWAERPQTARELRDNAPQLTRALRQADLAPGDIVIGDGTPPQPVVTARTGHFLDRAT